jgi:hypothetical protein
MESQILCRIWGGDFKAKIRGQLMYTEYRYWMRLAQFLVTNYCVLYVYTSIGFYSELIRALRPNPKKNMVYGTLCHS